jgi:hypothetical protein
MVTSTIKLACMKIFTLVGVLLGSLLLAHSAFAQESWPKTTTASNGTVIKMYQWQPESMADNTLNARAAISVLESGKTDPVFGVAWFKATTTTNGNEVQVQSLHINDIKLPGEENDDKLEALAVAMEGQVTSWNISFPASELQSSLDLNNKQTALSKEINNAPPKVIYSTVPAILVLIDGAPKLQRNDDWGVDAVVNTPFAIVKNNDGRFYLYGGKHWYTATAATGSYSLTTNVPQNLSKIEQTVNEANKKDENQEQESDENTIYKIIVSTEPAELVQTKGEPNFSAVQGTGLLYVSNSEDDVFMDINSQQYYVLLSGRWYKSKTLSGNWEYVDANSLPGDFARIPEGSPKDNVLASVPGTEAAKDAVLDAQVPQTAKVDRNNTKADITYDGDPEWDDIDGTDMAYATNTPASVIRWRGRYYSVDNGVWFESYNAVGPWRVAVVRPYAVALIPPRYPVYYMKYVYIYDVGPDYVYMGYTPGYLNTYIYGPTVVYGTGYYYRPWYGHYYYPRPCTWGYGVRYNPWFGWGLNISFSTGWFHMGFGNARTWNYWGGGGWWGPRVYRPPYCYSPYRSGGYYGGGRYYGYNNNRYGYNRSVTINVNRTNNIYNYRRDVVTRDNQRYVRTRDNGRQGWADNNRYNNSNNRFRSNNRDNTPNNPNNRFDGNRSGRVYNPGSNDNNNRDGNGGRTWNNSNRRNPDNGGGVTTPRTGNRNWGNNNNGDNPGRTTRPSREPVGVDRPSVEPVRRNNSAPVNRPEYRGDNRRENTTPPRVIQPQQPSREPVRREYSRPQQQQPDQSPRTMPQPSREPVRRESYGGGGGNQPQPRIERRESSRPSGGGEARPSRGGGNDNNRGGGDNGGGRGRRG